MSKGLDIYFQALNSKDDNERYNSFLELMKITEEKVDWFETYKNELFKKLKSSNSYQRSIGTMLLCNLGKSCTRNQINEFLSDLVLIIDDEKFITQRQVLQNIWKIAIVDKDLADYLLDKLLRKFKDCINEKHYNLLRKDIVLSLNEIRKRNKIEYLEKLIEDLIMKEDDMKYRKDYTRVLMDEEKSVQIEKLPDSSPRMDTISRPPFPQPGGRR